MARSRQVRRGMLDLPRQIRGEARQPRRSPSHITRIAARSSRLRSGDQIWKAAPIVLAEDEPDADKFGNCRAIPLCLPTRFLPGRRRTPISEIEAPDITQQFGFGGLRGRGVGQLVAMRGPTQDEPSAAELERDVRALSGSEPSRQIADERQTRGGAL